MLQRTLCFLALGLAASAPSAQLFNRVVSLGDSLLDDETGGARSPLVAEYLAERMDVPLTQLAVGGSTSSSLIAMGQHTSAAASFGRGDLAVLWIGGNDFFAAVPQLLSGGTAFLNVLENNVDTILSTLATAGMDILVINLPDMAEVPTLLSAIPSSLLPQVTAATIDWRARLEALAATHGALVGDAFAGYEALKSDPSTGTLAANPPVFSPSFGPIGSCPFCLFYDSIHPSSIGQAFITNGVIDDFNTAFTPLGQTPIVPLSETEILGLVVPVGNWTGLGGATVGAGGGASNGPDLVGAGALVPMGALSWNLSAGTAGTPVFLAFSFSSTPFPLFGGTLYTTSPLAPVALVFDAFGEAAFDLSFPATMLPAGTRIWSQSLALDSSAPDGFTLSNAMLAETP